MQLFTIGSLSQFLWKRWIFLEDKEYKHNSIYARLKRDSLGLFHLPDVCFFKTLFDLPWPSNNLINCGNLKQHFFCSIFCLNWSDIGDRIEKITFNSELHLHRISTGISDQICAEFSNSFSIKIRLKWSEGEQTSDVPCVWHARIFGIQLLGQPANQPTNHKLQFKRPAENLSWGFPGQNDINSFF